VPPCPSGLNCSGQQTTLSRFNGWGQRFLRDTPNAQSVFSYGTEGFNLLSETTRNLSTSALSTTDHIWLPTASEPMPIAAVIDGVHYAVHADHLNTPRRLTDASKAVKWQWPYSGFGEIAPQSTPAAGQAPLNYSLRYPGQIDDGNGLFYNWHRFYDPRVGRYTKADPIGLEGGWNRFGYVGANPVSYIDPDGRFALNAVGGFGGAVFGGAFGFFSAISYQMAGCKKFSDIDWWSVGSSTGLGAVSGAITGASFGAGGLYFQAAMGLTAGMGTGHVAGAIAGGMEKYGKDSTVKCGCE
jgi:RHS repeat-associated protein